MTDIIVRLKCSMFKFHERTVPASAKVKEGDMLRCWDPSHGPRGYLSRVAEVIEEANDE